MSEREELVSSLSCAYPSTVRLTASRSDGVAQQEVASVYDERAHVPSKAEKTESTMSPAGKLGIWWKETSRLELCQVG
jgi:hypothetical protein